MRRRTSPVITDAVTQANVEVVASAPAMASGNLFQATGQALGNAAHNATLALQNTNTVYQAATTSGVTLLYGITTATTVDGITEILASAG